jgi:hypothetical protein
MAATLLDLSPPLLANSWREFIYMLASLQIKDLEMLSILDDIHQYQNNGK